MLHPTSRPCPSFARVHNKRVAPVRRLAHQFYFVLANSLLLGFYLFLLVAITVNHDPDFRTHPRKLKLFEFPCFDWGVGKRIVIGERRGKLPSPDHLRQSL